MLEYQLKIDADGNVRYLMNQKGANVAGKMAFAQAVRIIGGEMPYVTEAFAEYPLTSDGVYFFDAMYRVTEDDKDDGDLIRLSAKSQAISLKSTFPKGEGNGNDLNEG